jgi:precorrin-6B methylase 2
LDIFLDIGHGLGNFPVQAAYRTGCEARGIEVDNDRLDISRQFSADFHRAANQLDIKKRRVSCSAIPTLD